MSRSFYIPIGNSSVWVSHSYGPTLVGSTLTVTLEISAEVPDGVPENVVLTVTENGRTLKFTNQGFERE